MSHYGITGRKSDENFKPTDPIAAFNVIWSEVNHGAPSYADCFAMTVSMDGTWRWQQWIPRLPGGRTDHRNLVNLLRNLADDIEATFRQGEHQR